MENMSEPFFDPPLVVQCFAPRGVLIDVSYPERLSFSIGTHLELQLTGLTN